MRKISFALIVLLLISFIVSCASVEVRAVRKGDIQDIRKFLADGGDPNSMDDDGNALIHIAVQYGQIASLETLLKADADANIKNRAGNSAIILAAERNRRDMINLLIKYGGDVRIAGSGGRTTLMLAASKGDVKLMDTLLKLGVPLNALDEKGRTALFYSVSAPDPEALSFLLEAGIDITVMDRDNGTPLHLLKDNSQAVMASMLIDSGVDLSPALHTNGETVLHIAARNGAWKLLEVYLSGDASSLINQSSSVEGTPLFYALNKRIPAEDSAASVELLLVSGANPNIPSVKNKLPLAYSVENLDVRRTKMLLRWGADSQIVLEEKKTLLHKAVERKNPDMISLLLDYNVDPNRRDLYGKTPLFQAVELRDEKSAEVLLSNGANPGINSNDGTNMLYGLIKEDAEKTSGFSGLTDLLLRYGAVLRPSKDPLHPIMLKAAQSGNALVLRFLLQSDVNPNVTESDGMTALMYTSAGQYIDLSELLIRWSADVNAYDKKGNRALHYAVLSASVPGVELLLKYGADPDPINFNNERPIELAPDNAQGQRIIELLLAAGAAPLPVEPVAVVDPVAPVNDEPVVEEDSPKEEGPVVAEEPENDGAAVIGGTDNPPDYWDKAKNLILGEDEPKKISSDRKVFPGYSASVPVSFPRKMHSKYNNQNVTLFIRNETNQTAEIYIVNGNGEVEAVSHLPVSDVVEFQVKQGNVYPIYCTSGVYFGAIKTTGQQEQYYRLLDQ